VIKIELLLASAGKVSPGSSVHAALSGGSGVRVTVHDPSLLSGLDHGEATASAPPFKYLVELACDSSVSATRPIDWVATRLQAVDGIDRARSTAIVGPEYTVVPGEEQIMLGMALTRRQDITGEAFSDYWRSTHAELGRSVPGSEGYRQVHLDSALTERARQVLGFGGPRFDGMALAYYSSQEAFEAIMANSEVTSALLADERRFIDHSKAAMIVGREPSA
jgi:uncharacterized protein (TIGR02118 family)